jgi:hypothetical protein
MKFGQGRFEQPVVMCALSFILSVMIPNPTILIATKYMSFGGQDSS